MPSLPRERTMTFMNAQNVNKQLVHAHSCQCVGIALTICFEEQLAIKYKSEDRI